MSQPAKGFAHPDDFLAVAPLFDLGFLPTESVHPDTTDFSNLASSDLISALALYRTCELRAVKAVSAVHQHLNQLATAIRHTWRNGGTVYMVGCGATGRLVSVLEAEHRLSIGASRAPIVSLLAGADFALVRSIENFEDHPEFGQRQLLEAGLKACDLVIGVSEGGETPFVLGATETAADITNAKAWFLFCNPTSQLLKIERSSRVIQHPNVASIEIATGPMVILGSTRLQASTALQLALLSALEGALRPGQLDVLSEFAAFLESTRFDMLAPLVRAEAEHLKQGALCLHESRGLGLTVLTDTTERSPTFSLAPFENLTWPDQSPAPTYFHQLGASSAEEAWSLLLNRPIRALPWEGFEEKYGSDAVLGFDFSLSALTRRTHEAQRRDQELLRISINYTNDGLILGVGGLLERSLLTGHRGMDLLAAKSLLNAWSTCTMSLCGRIRGNLMTHVRPTNGKLIDRARRLVQLRLEQESIPSPASQDLVHLLFQTRAEIDADASLRQTAVVERCVEVLRARRMRAGS